MNGAKKFHPPSGPAFNIGEVWVSGNSRTGYVVKIVEMRKFGPDKYDWDVTYSDTSGVLATKDSWNFQVRYEHQADLML